MCKRWHRRLTLLCIDKKIKGLPTWEINEKLILGVLSLKLLSKLTRFINKGISKKTNGKILNVISLVPFREPPAG